MSLSRLTARAAAFCASAALVPAVLAAIPDHPIITEVYTDPPGVNDGPVGRDPANLHQEYIEIYLPPAANLRPGLNKDALRLAFYEVEGDEDSTGPGLVNYRFDLPTFDLDPSNGLTPGAVARPAGGVVVLGWVDYLGNPPTALAGTAATRVALINGGVTSTPGYTFVPINGNQFGGTTNFAPVVAESLIDMPSETQSGIIQNGSSAYLLVNRDAAGYVQLYDDQHIPVGGSANPNLPAGTVLQAGCLMDGFAPNDFGNFDVLEQPYGQNNSFDLAMVLPDGGAFSRLICQLPERESAGLNPGIAAGYARRYVDMGKTTEDANTGNDDPVSDALNAYRHVRSAGPFYPTPGRSVMTTSAPELGVAASSEQNFSVLKDTIGRPALLCANVGGDFDVNFSTVAGASTNPAVATFSGGDAASAVAGQSFALPTVAISPTASAAHNSSASATVTVTATNAGGGDPAVLNPVQNVQITATVLNPTTGLNAAGQPFQTTVFAAVQPIVADAAANEFVATSLASWLPAHAAQAIDTWGHGASLLNAATDISNPLVVRPMVRDFPDPLTYVNPPGPAGRPDLVQTVLSSAEVLSGATTYEESFNVTFTALRGTRVNVSDTQVYGGSFTPAERINFAATSGRVSDPRSGLSNATTTRTFEIALLDTNVGFDALLESGATDDVGIVIEVLDTEPGSPVVAGEFVFLSFTGGLQGADIDGLEILPGSPVVANLVYLDLDNLHDVLGIKTIEQLWLIDAGGATNEIDFIEAWSLNLPPPPFAVGDCNCDGAVNVLDINAFVLAIIDAAAYAAQFPNCSALLADVNADGAADILDINPFVQLLAGG
ncbi:hypothetical protein RAS1_41580 [Phycisphaerae bacterium RAS1]|nr:hypothetical protein RAS1_41580 [Phycisphaerae bacterium RAS1]